MTQLSKKFSIICTVLRLHIILVFSAVSGDAVRYESHKLYEVRLEPGVSPRIKREIDRHILLHHVESHQNANLTVLVEPHEAARFETILKTNSISHGILNLNLQRMIDEEAKNIKPLNVSSEDFGWNSFYQLETIHAWLDHLTEKYSDLITPLTIGTSHEGRPLKGVKLSYQKDNTAVFIEAGIHAREWISPATATFILNQLLTSTEPRVQHIARNFDWIVFPVFNPDGYKYTFDVDRLWRKNRERFGACFGVDLNRNWNSSWSKITDESREPCGNNYPGPYVLSAPETRHFTAYLRENVESQRIQTYLSFHAAAQKLLFPYAANSTKAPNNSDLQRIGNKAIAALGERYGTDFEAGSANRIMYEVPGTSMDWVYSELSVPIVYVYELRRSKEEVGDIFARFLLPVDQIEAAGWETLDSVVALLNEAGTLGYYKSNSSSYQPFLDESTHSHSAVMFYGIGLSVSLVIVLMAVHLARKYEFCRQSRSDDRSNILYQA